GANTRCPCDRLLPCWPSSAFPCSPAAAGPRRRRRLPPDRPRPRAPLPPARTAAAPAAPAGGAATGTASISGKINFEGTPSAPEKIKTSADPKCQAMHPQGLERQTGDTSGGGLGGVLVCSMH